ncbi:MAG: SufS family cysteine desulfurase [Nanoarchaeota archaeon]
MNIKKDFPIFENNPDLIYLDNAANTQIPKQVINSIKEFYETENANINRGFYNLSINATKKYEQARKIIAKFINAKPEEIIFTFGTTDAINKLARTLPKLFNKKNEIVLSEMEHHSNLIPWQEAAKEFSMKLKFIPVKNFELDYDTAKKLINKNTAIVSITHVSNALGTINNIKKIIKLAKKNGALVVIDAAQSISRIKINVKKLGCDFLVFSGHKIYSPFGIGVLYGKKFLLEKIQPFNFGGNMIEKSELFQTTYTNPPRKFEAGTQNIAGAIALGESIKYLENLNIGNYEKKLTNYAIKKLREIKNLIIYSAKSDKNASLISFNLDGIHPHDVASILNEENIAIRAGHHCCMPLMSKLGISGTCRISFGIYNSKEDINKLINGLKKVQEIFKIK